MWRPLKITGIILAGLVLSTAITAYAVLRAAPILICDVPGISCNI